MAASDGIKPQKSKRKISLPWFRQGSVSAPHHSLTRQNTFDTAGGFHARLLRRQPSQPEPLVEMTWVMAEHVGAPGSQELTVHKGQQVEVIEGNAPADWCRVRLSTSGAESPPEGLVPLSVLKQPPSGTKTSPSRRQATDQDSEQGTSDGGGAPGAASSPVNKRRGFSGRKWLPPPLRKLSQGKEKSGAPDRPPLKKTPSDKKVAVEMGNKQGGVEEVSSSQLENGEEVEEDVVELPPPMKPIQEPLIVPSDETSGDGASNLSLQPLEGAAEIEQIVKERMEQHSEKQDRNSSVSEADDLKRRDFVLNELAESEGAYVRDLGIIVNGYMNEMKSSEIPMPEGLCGGKDKMVFGNIEAIYKWHRDFFLNQLEECVKNPEKLGPLFKASERKFQLYVIYCKNKPLSEYIVSEYIDTYFEEVRIKLGHRLTLGDLLIKPVQRLTKYHLMLKDICKLTERAGQMDLYESMQDAMQIMFDVPRSADEMMTVGRLQDFEGNITGQGKLLFNGTLSCTDPKMSAKHKDYQAFLFEQSIIFSDSVRKSRSKFASPIYKYKAHLQVNKMKMEKRSTEDEAYGRFTLINTDVVRTVCPGFSCTAPTLDLASQWVRVLENLQKSQIDIITKLQNPMAYSKGQTKEISPADSWNPTFRLPVPSSYEYSESLDSGVNSSDHCAVRTSSPTKNKHKFLDNMKNVLGRTRSKDPEDDLPINTEQADCIGPGVLARVTADFRALRPDELHVRSGDVVGVVRLGSRGCLVRQYYEDANSTGPEGWVPLNILTPQAGSNIPKKSWAFRFRKPSAVTREHGDPPVLLTAMHDTVVAIGERAQLTCRIRPTSGDIAVLWRLGTTDCNVVVRPGGRFAIYSSTEGECSLTIHGCRTIDAGQYNCTISNAGGSVSCSARLTVNDNSSADGEEDDGGSIDWQAEQFRRRYEVLAELGSGRMSVVCAARDRGTGHVVAVKQVQRSRQPATVTRAEYDLLATLRHAHLPRALALFVNAPDPSTDSIVMEFAKEQLLEFICRHNDYSEKTVRRAMRELTSAVACLHTNNAVHLDIRPENILVDGSGSVKLVDLGEGVRRLALPGAVLPPVSLEFAAPEMVLGKSAAAPADLWSLGVFLYVFLSGVSPFLDESLEETTGHILQGDFFFSNDHFSGVTVEAKELISSLLQTPPQVRGNAPSALLHTWFQMDKSQNWSTEKLRRFVDRRKSSFNILPTMKN